MAQRKLFLVRAAELKLFCILCRQCLKECSGIEFAVFSFPILQTRGQGTSYIMIVLLVAAMMRSHLHLNRSPFPFDKSNKIIKDLLNY